MAKRKKRRKKYRTTNTKLEYAFIDKKERQKLEYE
eukprot:CAMPEP_0116913288 /NCGR_PEP_ID=MMETSP0467-20121206/16608_1 /TAXON_ID=283647 /ORGANISM="Mesodinium pulex, Strain SPMC105" /LENGTH=34 /DNA_ID= /DNA_START= /DNA_END= /DNA_ORIENTATION=